MKYHIMRNGFAIGCDDVIFLGVLLFIRETLIDAARGYQSPFN